ncbi:hypothetical protein SIID45300_02523 [Candidatus Magnetaquicoccaceae bacterium FCR-1]|uniref:Uncharacterized protein n=1 Tax=Candidatus Magnetaquiglobus chichijimensis TaxID=3141448 RepID=A0ABQ0CBB8_9PROT
MKYVVELFDGKRIRGLLMDRQRKDELLAALDHIDPALGMVVLEITPQPLWKAEREVEQSRRRTIGWMDPARTVPVDRMMA